MKPSACLALSVLLAAPAPAWGEGLCPSWAAPRVAGWLDTERIPEASGLEWSPAHPRRLYHHNDSGDGPYLYITGPDGADAARIEIEGFAPRDVEDLAAGPCAAGTCLFLADIGDNLHRRRTVTIVAVQEPAGPFPSSVAPDSVVTAAYPDGPHNAEAAAMHPNGDLFVLTKTANGEAQLFRLSAAQIAGGGRQDFTEAARIDIAAITGGDSPRTVEATSMDIAADGERFVVLTYMAAIEFAADLSRPETLANAPTRLIPTRRLPQAEAIAYAGDGRSLVYDSEAPRGFSDIPLVLQVCEAG